MVKIMLHIRFCHTVIRFLWTFNLTPPLFSQTSTLVVQGMIHHHSLLIPIAGYCTWNIWEYYNLSYSKFISILQNLQYYNQSGFNTTAQSSRARSVVYIFVFSLARCKNKIWLWLIYFAYKYHRPYPPVFLIALNRSVSNCFSERNITVLSPSSRFTSRCLSHCVYSYQERGLYA